MATQKHWKSDPEKQMWTLGFRRSWRKMETVTQDTAGWSRVVWLVIHWEWQGISSTVVVEKSKSFRLFSKPEFTSLTAINPSYHWPQGWHTPSSLYTADNELSDGENIHNKPTTVPHSPFHCLTDQAPVYLADECQLISVVSTCRLMLSQHGDVCH